jgi:phosphatidylinositol dimannoside acyltransferase
MIDIKSVVFSYLMLKLNLLIALTFMATEARNIINSRYGLNLAYFIGRYMPAWMGRSIASFAADRIAARKDWPMVQAARLNQWVARGENLSADALDHAVRDNFRSTAHSIFDLYHNINNPEIFSKIIHVDPISAQFVQRPEFTERGLVIAAVHLSSFDFIGQVAGTVGVKAMYLVLPDLNPGYQKQLEMRREKGMNIHPTTPGAIKQAIRYLQNGGVVMTGIDRPEESNSFCPIFFGRPTSLTVHHVFLALKAQVPVLVAGVVWLPDQRYHLLFSDPIEMEPHPDRQTEIILNAEKILRVAEGYIRQYPSQWAMTFPLWPDIMDQVPG